MLVGRVLLIPSRPAIPPAMKRLIPIICFCFALVVQTTFAAEIDPLDWPYWRGPEGNSISRETGLPDTINPSGGEGSNLLWKRLDLGARSTPIVLRGKLYYIARHNPSTPTECEKTVCLDAATGETIWESIHNVWSSDVPDTRVGWSSVVGDPTTGNIFALGANGIFQCLDGATGKTLWQRALHEEFGLLSTYGGRTNYPVVHEDLVILGSVIIGWGEMALPAHRILAFNKNTGEVVWFISTRLRPEDTIYSAPALATINGQKLFITGSGDGWMYAIQPRTGKIVWEYQFSRRGLNLGPTVEGNLIYMGHSEENRADENNPALQRQVGAVAAIDGSLTGNITQTGEKWKVTGLAVGRSSILKWGDRLYCPDDGGKIFVLDAKTGEEIGRKTSVGTINFASPIYADGKIYHLEKNGRWYILTPDEENGLVKPVRGKTLGNFPTGDECWASPVISHGRLYILTTGGMYCFEDKSKPHAVTNAPAPSEEKPVAADQKPALVQVVPAEVLLQPGVKQKFTVNLFNANGQFLKASSASFELQGPGTISAEGEYVAGADVKHQSAILTAKVGDLSGRARIRIIPPLPWSFDFEGLKDAPVTWVGARYRHQLRTVDDSTAMVKITTIPKGTRSRCWFGPSDLSNYTIQADMKMSTADEKIPDIGLIAQGYTLQYLGESNEAQIGSWISHDKRSFTKLKPFTLDAGKWYTLKLRVQNEGDKALCQAKIWPSGTKEPTDWTIELVDPLPNKQGAPGLFGNATNAEIAIDNVSVVPNE